MSKRRNTSPEQAPKFSLGKTVITRGADVVLSRGDVIEALNRHVAGDWGDLPLEDMKANEWSLKNDARLLSAYHSRDGVKFWIITEADRSATTVLLPEEY